MNCQNLWKIAPLCLLHSSLACFAHAQADVGSTLPAEAIATEDAIDPESREIPVDSLFDDLRLNPLTNATNVESTIELNDSGRWAVTVQNSLTKRHNLEHQSRNLVQKILHTSDKDELKELHRNLHEIVSEQFNLLQKERENQLTELKKEFNRLQTLHDQRQDQSKRIVSDRVRALLLEAEGLGWGSSVSGNRSVRSSSLRLDRVGTTSTPKPVPLATPRTIKVESTLVDPASTTSSDPSEIE